MSDLRESGADRAGRRLILAIYREEVYTPDTPEKGIAEIIILKQRNGPIGTVKLTFRASTPRFENSRRAPATSFERLYFGAGFSALPSRRCGDSATIWKSGAEGRTTPLLPPRDRADRATL